MGYAAALAESSGLPLPLAAAVVADEAVAEEKSTRRPAEDEREGLSGGCRLECDGGVCTGECAKARVGEDGTEEGGWLLMAL